jgi:hypothetical protein
MYYFQESEIFHQLRNLLLTIRTSCPFSLAGTGCLSPESQTRIIAHNICGNKVEVSFLVNLLKQCRSLLSGTDNSTSHPVRS